MDTTGAGHGRADGGRDDGGDGDCDGDVRVDGADAASLLLAWRACWAAPVHLAVTHGPDAGWLLAAAGTVTVGRQGSTLAIADPALDHHHLTLRRDDDGVLRVRDERTENGTVLVHAPRHPGARRRRERRLERALDRGDGSARAAVAALARADGSGTTVTHRWRVLSVGDELLVGSSRLQVRAGPARGGVGDAGRRLGAPPGRRPRRGLGARRERDARRGRGSGGHRGGPRRLVLVLTVLPAIAMLGLLAGGRTSPALRWVMLGGVGLSVLVTLVLGARSARRRESRGDRHRPDAGGRAVVPGATDPAALALCAAGLGRLDERWLPVADDRRDAGTAGPATGGAGGTGGATVELDGGTVLGGAEGCRDLADPDGAASATRRLAAPPAGLAVAGEGADGVARWLRTQLEVAGRVDVPVLAAPTPGVAPPGPWTLVEAEGRSRVAPSWQRAVRAALSAVAAPSELADLLGRPTAQGIASAWLSGSTWTDTLTVPLGLDAAGRPHDVDLVADGPHALVAGTTGSGKSELLASWVIGMALRHPPRRLQLLLVDYKGGSTFAAAARLPHTVGVLTDLDAAASDRALAALRAELRRREHLVTAAGARGVGELTRPPARLVVVVDELRALVEDSPDRLGDLVRLATQGRSLGVHLVLATQRPSGVVNAQLRANVNLRLSLRVLDPSDSIDVIGSAVAAHLPPDPGAGFIQTGGAPVRLRVAWLPGTAAEDLVEQAGRAADRVRRARRADLLAVHRPWLPELPSRISRRDVSGLDRGEAERGSPATDLTAALVMDEPEHQRRSLWSWHDGTVLVSGEPRSGRTTALQTLAAVEATSGRGCHVVSRTGWSPSRSAATTDAGRGRAPTGTTVGTDDPRRVHRLLTLLAGGADPGASLVVDDVEQVLDAIDEASGPGSGQELLTAVLRSRGPARIALATTSPHRWAPFAAHHLALRVRDVGAAGLVGVPRALVRTGAPPGRGVLLGGEHPLEVQVVLDDGSPAGAGFATPGPGPTAARLVLAPLPDSVGLDDLLDGGADSGGTSGGGSGGSGDRGTEPWSPLLGVGGDDAVVVGAELVPGRPWLVCGPAGSGRTGVLGVVAAQCVDPVVRVSPDSPLDGDPPRDALLLVDDAEMLDGAASDALAALTATHRAVVATSATAPQTAYRGVVATVAQARTVVALGGALPPHCAYARAARDPRGGVGRAVLVIGTRAVPIQVAHRREPPASPATPSRPPRPPPRR